VAANVSVQMNLHRYKVYYEFNGPTKGEPLRTEKTTDQVTDALGNVSFELSVYLADDSAKISTSPDGPNAIMLTVDTTQPDDVFLLAMKMCLKGLDLYAKKLQ
jgi:hypothetical protein